MGILNVILNENWTNVVALANISFRYGGLGSGCNEISKRD